MNEILSQNGLKIFHLNIRSLTSKLDQFKLLLENKNIDIFSLSETWLHTGISSNILSIPGYAFVRYDRETVENVVKRGGGLGVYYNPIECLEKRRKIHLAGFMYKKTLRSEYLVIGNFQLNSLTKKS